MHCANGASNLASAKIEIGPGQDPRQWTEVLSSLSAVDSGEIGLIPASNFQGSSVWILRLIVTDSNGSSREARFRQQVG